MKESILALNQAYGCAAQAFLCPEHEADCHQVLLRGSMSFIRFLLKCIQVGEEQKEEMDNNKSELLSHILLQIITGRIAMQITRRITLSAEGSLRLIGRQ